MATTTFPIANRARPRVLHAPTDAATAAAWLEWRTEETTVTPTLTVAELSECRCPGLCDRDHANE